MRKIRLFLSDDCYHVTMRCNNREFKLVRLECREVLLYALNQCREKYAFKLYSICILSNHVHYLIKPEVANELPRIMHWLNWYTAMCFNRMLNRTEHFWEQRYHSVGFPSSDYRRVLNTLRYIHANPKAAGMQRGFSLILAGILSMILHNFDRCLYTPNPDLPNPDQPNPYEQFWNRAAAGMYRASVSGHFLEVNPAYAEVLEYDSALQLVGTVTCIAYDVYQSPTRWSELLTYLHQERTIQGFESLVWTGKGTVRWVTECVRLVSDEQNGRYILEGVVHDITDRRRQALTREWTQLNQTRDESFKRHSFKGYEGVKG